MATSVSGHLIFLFRVCCCVSLVLPGTGRAQMIFTEVSQDIEASLTIPLGSSTFGDYDNDGWPDMFLSRPSTTVSSWTPLLHNEGDGRFGDQTRALRVDLADTVPGGGGIFGDYDNDRDLDLFVAVGASWRKWEAPNSLLRNDQGVFRDVTASAGLTDPQPTNNAIWKELKYRKERIMIRTVCTLMMLIIVGIISTGAQEREKVPIISRQVLFGNPDKASLRISPDAEKISYRAPLDGVMNVWVAPADDPSAAVPVTRDTLRGIRIYFWAYTNEHILYLQDLAGDENWQVHAVNVETKEDRNLTPFEEIMGPEGNPLTLPNGKKMRPRAQIQEVSYKFDEEILIGLNHRNPKYHDIHRLNVLTGEMSLVQQNDRFLGFQTDDDYHIRYALEMTPDGGNELFTPDGSGGWKSFDKIPMEDMLTTWPITFDKTGQVLYMIDSRGRNTAALTSVEVQTGSKKVIFEDPRADLSNIMIHPTEKIIEAAASNFTRIEWKILHDSIRSDMDYLKTLADGDVTVASRSLDDSVWVVIFVIDNGPVRYYLYHRTQNRAQFLFTNRKELESVTLSRMHPVIINITLLITHRVL